MDITPLSLGIKVVGGKMNVIIPRNTKVPISITKPYTTNFDNQDHVIIEIFEGELPDVKDCHKLGEFELGGIPPMP